MYQEPRTCDCGFARKGGGGAHSNVSYKQRPARTFALDPFRNERIVLGVVLRNEDRSSPVSVAVDHAA